MKRKIFKFIDILTQVLTIFYYVSLSGSLWVVILGAGISCVTIIWLYLRRKVSYANKVAFAMQVIYIIIYFAAIK